MIVATVGLLDNQLTELEILPVVPSEYVPIAVKVTDCPLGTEGAFGLMLIPVIAAVVTMMLVADEVIPLNEAMTVVKPTVIPVAMPELLEIVATAVLPDDQATWLVIFAEEPSE